MEGCGGTSLLLPTALPAELVAVATTAVTHGSFPS